MEERKEEKFDLKKSRDERDLQFKVKYLVISCHCCIWIRSVSVEKVIHNSRSLPKDSPCQGSQFANWLPCFHFSLVSSLVTRLHCSRNQNTNCDYITSELSVKDESKLPWVLPQLLLFTHLLQKRVRILRTSNGIILRTYKWRTKRQPFLMF